MTPEERAAEVEIVELDMGDMHVSRWEVQRGPTNANIATAIRAAVKEEREACARLLDEMAQRVCTDEGRVYRVGAALVRARATAPAPPSSRSPNSET